MYFIPSITELILTNDSAKSFEKVYSKIEDISKYFIELTAEVIPPTYPP
jgi:hypothetical protein